MGRSLLLPRRTFVRTALASGAALLAPNLVTKAEARPWDRADAIAAGVRRPSFPDRDVSILSFGAVGNAARDCTDAIRRAIEACHAAGGGRVVVPKGRYRTGAIHLKRNVNLHVERGATLLFSTDPDDYLPVVLTRFEGNDLYNYSPLIYAQGEDNVAVTGAGTLDGQAGNGNWWAWSGKEVYGWKPGIPNENKTSRTLRAEAEAGMPVEKRVYGKGKGLRPSFVEFFACERVLIEGVTLKNAPMWSLHPCLCRDVTIKNVEVLSPVGPNNDGCDPECCENVLIEGCHFDTRDDCIAIKSGRGRDGFRRERPSRNIVIRNCRMSRGIGAIAIGSEMSGGVENVYAENLVMDDPRLEHVFYLKSNTDRGGVAKNVFVRKVRSAGTAFSTVHLTYDYLQRGPGGPYRPRFANVNLWNVQVQKGYHAIRFVGLPGNPLQDVNLSRCRFDNHTGRAVYLSNAKDITLDDVFVNGRRR